MATATTFNRSKILKSAWTLVKTQGLSLSQAMKMAWAEAKAPKVEAKAQKLKKAEIEKGLELIARYSSTRPQILEKNKVQERIEFLKSLTNEQIEKFESFIEASVTGGLRNYEIFKSYIN